MNTYREFEIKENSIVEFVGICWDKPEWDYDCPCVLVSPVLKSDYNDPETLIEDTAIEASVEGVMESCDPDDVEEMVSIGRLKSIIKKIIKGEKAWVTKNPRVVVQKIRFYLDEDKELLHEVLESNSYENTK